MHGFARVVVRDRPRSVASAGTTRTGAVNLFLPLSPEPGLPPALLLLMNPWLLIQTIRCRSRARAQATRRLPQRLRAGRSLLRQSLLRQMRTARPQRSKRPWTRSACSKRQAAVRLQKGHIPRFRTFIPCLQKRDRSLRRQGTEIPRRRGTSPSRRRCRWRDSLQRGLPQDRTRLVRSLLPPDAQRP